MERELIDKDPLNYSFWRIGGNYETIRHKLALCASRFPIHEHGDFILLGNKDLLNQESNLYFRDSTNKGFGHSFEVYSKREWLIKWCEEKIENGFGWYLLKDVAPLFLRELENGNSYIHFFDLVKEYELQLLKEQMDQYKTPMTEYEHNVKMRKTFVNAETVKLQEYTGGGNLCESVLIKNSINFRKAVFGDLLRNGKVLMLHHPNERLELIEEIEYYGRGDQVAPLAGSGGIHFVYNDVEIYYYQTWIS